MGALISGGRYPTFKNRHFSVCIGEPFTNRDGQHASLQNKTNIPGIAVAN